MARRIVKDPIYVQLNDLLRSLLASGQFAPGQQFLTEREVCGRFDVSRATANKALSNLVAEGILEFRKGVGTFVRRCALDYDLAALVSFTEKARAAGREPSTRMLEFCTLLASKAPAEVGRALSVGDDEHLHYIERLRLADGAPVILERRHVVARLCPALSVDDLAGSLYAAWTERYDLELGGAEQVIRAVALARGDAELLNVEEGAAALEVRCVGWLVGGEPLWNERTLYRSDVYEIRNRLGPLRSAGPATVALVAGLPPGRGHEPD